MAEKNETALPHSLHMEDRRLLKLSGVSDVDTFDETESVIYTSMGELTVKGEGLHIQQFSMETGDLLLEGTVRELVYTDVRARSDNFFRKLFR